MVWALAGWLSWLDRGPVHQKVSGLIPVWGGQGAYGRQLVHAVSHLHVCVVSLSPSSTLYKPMEISSGEDLKAKQKSMRSTTAGKGEGVLQGRKQDAVLDSPFFL